MPKYIIWYEETYGKEYEIKAKDPSDAKDKLYNDIFQGLIDGPEECVDSQIVECIEVKEDNDGSN